jgi:apolipoprotein D and lipocalin family protein
MSEARHVTSVDHLDLPRYTGLWHEIGRLPLKWEDADATEITAHYTAQEDGSVLVDNRCFDGDGQPTRSLGKAARVAGHQARLKVSFAPALIRWLPFTQGDYWVLKIDEGYQYALVGTPDHENLWLLARTPQVGAEVEQEFLAEAQRQGFDLTSWIRPVQTGRIVTDELLA